MMVLFFGAVAASGYQLLYLTWHPSRAMHWSIGAGSTLLYLLGYTRLHLPMNRSTPAGQVLPRLGISNALTLLRGLCYGLLAGFVVLPLAAGVWRWLPGALFTIAALTDLVDGALARKRGETTDLGAKLDVEVDSIGILVATVLAVKMGQLPGIFLVMGGLFYLYQGGMWGRRRLGKIVHALPHDPWRPIIGGVQVGYLCVILWPVFNPPLTVAAGGVVFAAVTGSFLHDGLIAIGWLDPAHSRYLRRRRTARAFFLGAMPLLLRSAMLLLGIHLFQVYGPSSPASPASASFVALSSVMLTGIVLMGVGVAARIAALLVLVSGCTLYLIVGPEVELIGAVVGAFMLLIVGPGWGAGWTPSERIWSWRRNATNASS